ncbi:MAG: GtrA family protein [Firmicutes bacterium]|nr:GtrA family protein [Bacillota bacterium]
MKMNQERHENYIQATKFLLFSISAGVIQALTFTFFYEIMKLEYWPAYLISLTLSVLWNFTLNRKFTFKSAANIPLAMSKVAFFYLIFTPLSTWWGDALTNLEWNAYLVLGLTMITNLVTEFLYTKYYVYKNNINTALK